MSRELGQIGGGFSNPEISFCIGTFSVGFSAADFVTADICKDEGTIWPKLKFQLGKSFAT